ncbi:MAG: EFR1 family ferrodoxin, partial [Spirochaetaceae bacterium]|nr:EFR1 family ferrodoxin [Spirochaetaceae bacterium]
SIDEVNKKRIEKSDIKINQVIEELKEEKFRLAKWRPKLLGFIFYLLYNSMSKHYAEGFKLSDDCINCCDICYRGCPSNNITMIDNKPSFGNNCLACTACINNCPTNAIYRKKEKGKQYKNPVFKFEQFYR